MVFFSSAHNINARVHFIKQKSLHNQGKEGSGAVGKTSVLGGLLRDSGSRNHPGGRGLYEEKQNVIHVTLPSLLLKFHFLIACAIQ